MKDMHAAMRKVDAIVHPSRFGNLLTLTNLTGHPTFVAPHGQSRSGAPGTISFTGRLMEDDRLLALACAWQRMTDHHKKHPQLDD